MKKLEKPIKKLLDLKTVLSWIYKYSDQPYIILLELGDVTWELNLQYFSGLKEYQVLKFELFRNKEKVNLDKSDIIQIIKWTDSQGNLYKLLTKIIKKYWWR